MKRRAGETILIGRDIEILVAHIGRNRVRLGITAPRTLPVVAKEVNLVSEENRAAAQVRPQLLAGLGTGAAASRPKNLALSSDMEIDVVLGNPENRTTRTGRMPPHNGKRNLP